MLVPCQPRHPAGSGPRRSPTIPLRSRGDRGLSLGHRDTPAGTGDSGPFGPRGLRGDPLPGDGHSAPRGLQRDRQPASGAPAPTRGQPQQRDTTKGQAFRVPVPQEACPHRNHHRVLNACPHRHTESPSHGITPPEACPHRRRRRGAAPAEGRPNRGTGIPCSLPHQKPVPAATATAVWKPAPPAVVAVLARP